MRIEKHGLIQTDTDGHRLNRRSEQLKTVAPLGLWGEEKILFPAAHASGYETFIPSGFKRNRHIQPQARAAVLHWLLPCNAGSVGYNGLNDTVF